MTDHDIIQIVDQLSLIIGDNDTDTDTDHDNDNDYKQQI